MLISFIDVCRWRYLVGLGKKRSFYWHLIPAKVYESLNVVVNLVGQNSTDYWEVVAEILLAPA